MIINFLKRYGYWKNIKRLEETESSGIIEITRKVYFEEITELK